jgi:hypothetical protein
MDGQERVSLSDAATFLLDECRMVLPGIQALFGFQLIAVFNSRFTDEFSAGEQQLHFIAIALVAIAIAIIMTPAALHRQIGVRHVTASFIAISTRLLLASMVPLAAGIVLDFYLVTRLLVDGPVAVPAAIVLFAVFAFFWGLVPRSKALQNLLDRPTDR